MYDYLKGKLERISPTHAVIDVQGVGYLVQISLQTYEQVKSQVEVKLFVDQLFKIENQAPAAIVLYGFNDEDERLSFRLLTSVSGVGNNTALLMLSALEPPVLNSAILSGNIGLLKGIKGIGEKTAQRIVLELRDKLGNKKSGATFLQKGVSDNLTEATMALTTLGYTRIAIEKAISKVVKTNMNASVEELIKESLKIM